MNKVFFTPCPSCRKNGHDRQGDNLANYPDGSAYCFRCGYYKHKNSVTLFKAPLTLPKITLPADCNTSYPSKILDWMQSFQLTKTDLLHNGALWSDSLDRLIFPFWIDGELKGYQARSIKKGEKNKWLAKGNIKDLNIIYSGGRSVTQWARETRLFLVEDIISAIKVSKANKEILAMPLFGVNFKPLQLVKLQFKEYIIFLDENMHEHSIKKARQMSHYGIHCSIILSKCDPKRYTYEELKMIIGN